MLTLRKSMNQYYSEAEAARTLCITVDALHNILDEHIFDDAHPRPPVLEFTYAELLLLSVWAETERGGNVVAMPSKS